MWKTNVTGGAVPTTCAANHPTPICRERAASPPNPFGRRSPSDAFVPSIRASTLPHKRGPRPRAVGPHPFAGAASKVGSACWCLKHPYHALGARGGAPASSRWTCNPTEPPEAVDHRPPSGPHWRGAHACDAYQARQARHARDRAPLRRGGRAPARGQGSSGQDTTRSTAPSTSSLDPSTSAVRGGTLSGAVCAAVGGPRASTATRCAPADTPPWATAPLAGRGHLPAGWVAGSGAVHAQGVTRALWGRGPGQREHVCASRGAARGAARLAVQSAAGGVPSSACASQAGRAGDAPQLVTAARGAEQRCAYTAKEASGASETGACSVASDRRSHRNDSKALGAWPAVPGCTGGRRCTGARPAARTTPSLSQGSWPGRPARSGASGCDGKAGGGAQAALSGRRVCACLIPALHPAPSPTTRPHHRCRIAFPGEQATTSAEERRAGWCLPCACQEAWAQQTRRGCAPRGKTPVCCGASPSVACTTSGRGGAPMAAARGMQRLS